MMNVAVELRMMTARSIGAFNLLFERFRLNAHLFPRHGAPSTANFGCLQ